MKKDVRELFSRELFFHYFCLEHFKVVHCQNKFREGLSEDTVAKISSTEFAVFEPGKPEHSFCENFCH